MGQWVKIETTAAEVLVGDRLYVARTDLFLEVLDVGPTSNGEVRIKTEAGSYPPYVLMFPTDCEVQVKRQRKPRKPLSEAELEKAARLFCELGGVNQDESIACAAEPDANGFVPAVNVWRKRWQIAADRIREHDLLQTAIDLARGQ